MTDINELQSPFLIDAGIAVDDRGQLMFANDFDFKKYGIRRFYAVTNHKQGFIRAWHGHKNEAKFVLVAKGATVVNIIKIDNWENPSKDLEIQKFVLSAEKPSILYIPAGYVNGFMTLTQDTQVFFFSTSTIEESKGDDIRFESRYWNPWEIVER